MSFLQSHSTAVLLFRLQSNLITHIAIRGVRWGALFLFEWGRFIKVKRKKGKRVKSFTFYGKMKFFGEKMKKVAKKFGGIK